VPCCCQLDLYGDQDLDLGGFRQTSGSGQPRPADGAVHLDKLKGIGPKYKEMLKSIGVDSIKELRHRNPAHLKEMIEERHGSVVGLSEHEAQGWIGEAKAYQE
jgi:hypothetical protein